MQRWIQFLTTRSSTSWKIGSGTKNWRPNAHWSSGSWGIKQRKVKINRPWQQSSPALAKEVASKKILPAKLIAWRKAILLNKVLQCSLRFTLCMPFSIGLKILFVCFTIRILRGALKQFFSYADYFWSASLVGNYRLHYKIVSGPWVYWMNDLMVFFVSLS